MIQIKNAKELDGMRKANALSAAALKYGGEHIEAGMTTWELDKLIYDFIVKHGGIPNFKGLYGFPLTLYIKSHTRNDAFLFHQQFIFLCTHYAFNIPPHFSFYTIIHCGEYLYQL